MTWFVACPHCNRHVKVEEEQCPFCSAALDLSGIPEPVAPKRHLSRAATLALGATMAGALSGACGDDSANPIPVYGGPASGGAAQVGSGGNAGIGASSGTSANGGSSASGGSSANGGTGALSGAAGSAGVAGSVIGVGGGAVPVYGAPARGGTTGVGSGGRANSAGTGNVAVPVYGAPAGGVPNGGPGDAGAGGSDAGAGGSDGGASGSGDTGTGGAMRVPVYGAPASPQSR